MPREIITMQATFCWKPEEADGTERCIECGDVCYLFQHRLQVRLGEDYTILSEFVRCEACER
jgi:hypothetical protein